MQQIDLNSDMGEGFGRWSLGDDETMLETVTSANVACGFHAGDPETMTRVVAAAAARGVQVGAHVAYRDLAGFGRRYVDATEPELVGDVVYQIGALQGIARSVGAEVTYVKAHGALYNTIASDERHARAVLTAITRYDPSLAVVGLAGSRFLEQARAAGLRTVAEAFADRAYTADGALLSRREPGAVLHDPDEVAERMVQLVRTGTVEAVDGTRVDVRADSLCVHSDSPGAVAMAQAVRTALEGAGIAVRPFLPADPGAGS
ncbi:LamB/YcsF family protein [Kineococcus rubinsiae]|uniref:LamB/YcsF family protein n=1 Tax=Kineococcus rubinsiae TaxID=2609562 RepID=UPI00143106FD|nr:5-oxoprolinase subunit PxpA [Kineococcus rubinsiae]NIZ91697.1 LamB/YcsF family protein [Kineococcus rubinsiae]